MIELALNGIQKYFGATKVLDNITFEVQTSEKVGVIGRNGSGKTTILKIMAGIEKQDGGMLFIKKGYTIGYLDQIPEYPEDYSVRDVLYIAFENQLQISDSIKDLEQKIANLQGSELDRVLMQYGELQQLFEVSGGYEMEEKFSKVCIGLKLDAEFQEMKFSSLSGGEKTRVILAKILLQEPDVMLLDEPSNHLDMDSVEWLESFLKEYRGIALIVSHDRYFLDRVASKIIEVEDMCTETYMGNYSDYIKEKETSMMLQFEAYEDQQKKIKAMEKAIKQLKDWYERGGNAKFIRRAFSMQKRLDKMSKIEKPLFERPNMQLNFSSSDRSGNDVVRVKDLYKGFGEVTIFQGADLNLRYAERAAIIGRNGSGKTTLLKLLMKEYDMDGGSIYIGAGVKIGYLPQNIFFSNEENNVLECFREDKNILEGKAREYLSKFMFYGESVFKKVKNLSGGEKSRLKLGLLMYEDINFLILDEPTNHLDIDSRETLEEALSEFKGTILFISHDRYFINVLCSRVVELRDKSFVSYGGNYEYFRQKREELKNTEKIQKGEQTVLKAKFKNEEDKKQKERDAVNENKRRELQKQKLEERLEVLEMNIKEVDGEMHECSSDFNKLNELYCKKDSLQQEIDILMEQWLNLA